MIARLALLALLIGTDLSAAPRYERRVDVQTRGPQRLEPDLTLLAGSAPGFADLRVFDGAGNEVPYIVVQAPAREAQWIPTSRFLIAPTKKSSGIEGDAGRTRTIDAIRIDGVPSPFLKRVRIEGSGDRNRWTVLADTTVFDLPAETLERRVVEFRPVDVRYVRLTWDDTSSAPVGGAVNVAMRIHRPEGPAPSLRSAVPLQGRPSEPGRSRYRIDLPAPRLPIRAIQFQLPLGDVHRNVTISEPRLTGSEIVPVVLGRGQLRQAQRNDMTASDARIAILSPSSDELDIVIEDGSNTPLAITAANLELEPQPWIYFEAAEAGAYTARYGDADARAPRYDLEAARPLLARVQPAVATWGGPSALAAGSEPQRIAPPTEGAVLDRKSFSVARPLAAGEAGMSVLTLDAEVLARSRDLADVRIAKDEDDRQVPFIVEQRAGPTVVEIIVPNRVEEAGRSRYTLPMPYRTLPAESRLVLTARPALFERQVTVVNGSDEGRDATVIASVTWRHTDADRDPAPLTINLPRTVGQKIELRVDEGDNAPLQMRDAHLIFPSYALRFIHPGTPLTLLYGNRSVGAPKYDLALIAPRLFNEPAGEVSFAGRTVEEEATGNGERSFFWIAIGAVVLALLLILGRIVRVGS